MKILSFAVAVAFCAPAWGQVSALNPSAMKRIGSVDARFQSFNVEMVEVTGGRFWAPYRAQGREEAPAAAKLAVPGLDPSLFRQRTPIDLANPRLRKLAAALGPTYVRVSGTWANSTYFHDSDSPAPAAPPEGFGGVLTRAQWRGVIDFTKAVDGRIVTSFAIAPGVRDEKGAWTPREAVKVVAFTKAAGGSIAAAEFFNEPNLAAMGGAPKGYDAAQYGRDFGAFRAFARGAAPDMKILGPGSVGEGGMMVGSGLAGMKSEDMLRASDGGLDGFSYHFYGGVSKRCAAMAGAPQTTAEAALSEDWLSKTDADANFYTALRDRMAPGKPLWLTETGETACGGNPWASSFLDTFRYLDQLGRLAKRGVQVVAHNTLAASDYGLIDEETLTPRPNYWAALLWRRLMGTGVLDAGAAPAQGVHVYAHCMAGRPGGVAVLAINPDRAAEARFQAPKGSEVYALTARDLAGGVVALNGRDLAVGSGGSLPEIKGAASKTGAITVAPASIAFIAVPGAGNAACR